jgi:hypothetical protein
MASKEDLNHDDNEAKRKRVKNSQYCRKYYEKMKQRIKGKVRTRRHPFADNEGIPPFVAKCRGVGFGG